MGSKKNPTISVDELLSKAECATPPTVSADVRLAPYLEVVDKLVKERGFRVTHAFSWVVEQTGISRHSLSIAYYRRKRVEVRDGQ